VLGHSFVRDIRVRFRIVGIAEQVPFVEESGAQTGASEAASSGE